MTRAAGSGCAVDLGGGVANSEVDRPDVRHALGAVVPHRAGDEPAVLGEVDVAAVLRTGGLRGPAEQLAVERGGAVGIAGEQVDPAGCSGGGVGCRHGGLLDRWRSLCRRADEGELIVGPDRRVRPMPSPAAVERASLCDLFLEVGPDAPTLCGDWTTRDLAAHLVVRERRPDAAAGIVCRSVAGYSEKVRVAETERPWTELVERVRSGPAGVEPDAPRAGRRASPTASSSSSTTRTSAGPRPAGRPARSTPTSRTRWPTTLRRGGGMLDPQGRRSGSCVEPDGRDADAAAQGRAGRHDPRPDRRVRAVRLRPQGRRRGRRSTVPPTPSPPCAAAPFGL